MVRFSLILEIEVKILSIKQLVKLFTQQLEQQERQQSQKKARKPAI